MAEPIKLDVDGYVPGSGRVRLTVNSPYGMFRAAGSFARPMTILNMVRIADMAKIEPDQIEIVSWEEGERKLTVQLKVPDD